MNNARVINGVICYHVNDFVNLKNLFESRFLLYKQFYNHFETQSYECLFVDILNEIDGILYDFLKAIKDPKQFLTLDD